MNRGLALVWPRLVLAAGATLVALLAPILLVPLVAVGAGFVLWRLQDIEADGTPLRSAGSIGLTILVTTFLVTPVWLVLLVGVQWIPALLVSGALAVRLSAVFFIGFAFTAAVSPACWFASLHRFPRLALALMLTMRQIPEFTQDSVRLRAAQQGRGLLVGRRAWRPLVFLVPLFSRGLERADRLSTALLLSGWGQAKARPVAAARATGGDAWFVLGGLVLAGFALLPRFWLAL